VHDQGNLLQLDARNPNLTGADWMLDLRERKLSTRLGIPVAQYLSASGFALYKSVL
jgi:hypothetical protein